MQLEQTIVLMNGNERVPVEMHTIDYAEAAGAYTHLFLRNGKRYIESKTLKYYEQLLEKSKLFCRISPKHLVNLTQVARYSAAEVVLRAGMKLLPSSRGLKRLDARFGKRTKQKLAVTN